MPIVNPILKYVVRIQKISNIAADQVMNTWYTDSVTTPTATYAALTTFYDAWISTYGGGSIGSTAYVDRYQMPAVRGPLGVPLETHTMALSSPGVSTPWPDEVATTISFHSDYTGVPEHGPGATRPRATLRGRIYLGPLNTAAGEVTTSANETRPAAAFLANLKTYLTAFHTAVSWVQWSNKNWEALPVVGGWIDNAFDTQRRRGPAATARTLWP
jgi:hypothetical protein